MYFEDQSELRDVVKTLCRMISPETILEFGCNSGPNARFLSKLEIKEYYGLDINEAALEFAKNNINDNRFKFINNHTQN